MYGVGSKKMLNMLILAILEQYSDREHRLTQQEIIRLLKINYDVECDRRSVKSNLLCLEAMGYDISMENGNYLASRTFEDGELRLLIDSVLCSKNITNKQAHELIDKLKSQGNKYFSPKVSHVCNLPSMHHGDNQQLFYVLEVLNNAISEHAKVSFTYNAYNTEFKLKPKRAEKYIVNPYQLVTANGYYYLIGNYDKYDNISHYRVDKITDITQLKEKAKSMKKIQGLEQGLNLPKHMAEHIYMFRGESVLAELSVPSNMMNELVDWFGKEFRIVSQEAERMVIQVRCNEEAMLYWTLQYGAYVELLTPLELRSKVQRIVKDMYAKYIKA